MTVNFKSYWDDVFRDVLHHWCCGRCEIKSIPLYEIAPNSQLKGDIGPSGLFGRSSDSGSDPSSIGNFIISIIIIIMVHSPKVMIASSSSSPPSPRRSPSPSSSLMMKWAYFDQFTQRLTLLLGWSAQLCRRQMQLLTLRFGRNWDTDVLTIITITVTITIATTTDGYITVTIIVEFFEFDLHRSGVLLRLPFSVSAAWYVPLTLPSLHERRRQTKICPLPSLILLKD